MRRFNSSNATTGTHIKFKAPKPFILKNDFKTFSELVSNVLEDDTFDVEVKIIRTLLTPEAYRDCRSVFGIAQNFPELLSKMQEVLCATPTHNSVANIDKFHACKQEPAESQNEFSNQIRLLAADAHPGIDTVEPYMLQPFINGLNVSKTNKNLLNAITHTILSNVLTISSRL